MGYRSSSSQKFADGLPPYEEVGGREEEGKMEERRRKMGEEREEETYLMLPSEREAVTKGVRKVSQPYQTTPDFGMRWKQLSDS